MKLSIAYSALLAVALSLSPSYAFQTNPLPTLHRRTTHDTSSTTLFSSTPTPEEMKRIMEEESTNPEVLAQSAAAMKNMSSDDMGKLISEMETMPDAQKEQLKSMGMDPDTSE